MSDSSENSEEKHSRQETGKMCGEFREIQLVFDLRVRRGVPFSITLKI